MSHENRKIFAALRAAFTSTKSYFFTSNSRPRRREKSSNFCYKQLDKQNQLFGGDFGKSN